MRLTDVADVEQLLRLIQLIPSKKAEPFKQWLAKVGSEILDEVVDPELSIDPAIQNYRNLGYSENRINQRIKSYVKKYNKRLVEALNLNSLSTSFVPVLKQDDSLAMSFNVQMTF